MKFIKPVIHHRNLSRKPPIQTTIIIALIVKDFNLLSSIPGAICVGVVGVLVLGMWGLYLRDLIRFNELPKDIFHEQNPNNSPKVQRTTKPREDTSVFESD